jgi:hypothetical protein
VSPSEVDTESITMGLDRTKVGSFIAKGAAQTPSSTLSAACSDCSGREYLAAGSTSKISPSTEAVPPWPCPERDRPGPSYPGLHEFPSGRHGCERLSGPFLVAQSGDPDPTRSTALDPAKSADRMPMRTSGALYNNPPRFASSEIHNNPPRFASSEIQTSRYLSVRRYCRAWF